MCRFPRIKCSCMENPGISYERLNEGVVEFHVSDEDKDATTNEKEVCIFIFIYFTNY